MLLACSSALIYAEEHTNKLSPVEDAQGNLHVPTDYRDHYEYLGAWSVAADKTPGAKQLHVVYASPGTRAVFQRTGKFPDDTVLVKEQFEAETAPMTSGTASHQQKLLGWFVMVKDDTNRHTGNPLWGEGWGWSHFDANAPTRTNSTNYKSDCKGCHLPAKATGYIYIQGYPSLH
ncbi:MAG TPA: cytochrome P460 family protein [Bryobacteraceae bacterium]